VLENLPDATPAQGTYEFMSHNLVDTLRSSSSYLHSPVDDLESFYYTAQWAAAFNDGAMGGKRDGASIREFREKISGDGRLTATHALMLKGPDFWRQEQQQQRYGAFFANSTVILRPWFGKLITLAIDWQSVLIQARKLEGTEKEYLADSFLVFGYRGVAEYLQLIHEHRELLEKTV